MHTRASTRTNIVCRCQKPNGINGRHLIKAIWDSRPRRTNALALRKARGSGHADSLVGSPPPSCRILRARNGPQIPSRSTFYNPNTIKPTSGIPSACSEAVAIRAAKLMPFRVLFYHQLLFGSRIPQTRGSAE